MSDEHETNDEDQWLLKEGDLVAKKYCIVCFLASGGMGEVYKAKHVFLKKLVAIKVLSPLLARNKETLRRFMREAQAPSRFNRDDIITVLDYDKGEVKAQNGEVKQELYFLAMEYLTGNELEKVWRGLPLCSLFPILIQVAKALAVVHKGGVIHRDIKPTNIYRAEDDEGNIRTKLIDFGIAHVDEEADIKVMMDSGRLTQTGQIIGSPSYMAPEQMRGKDIDPRVDVYSLGVMLYEFLTGDIPFPQDSMTEMMEARKKQLKPLTRPQKMLHVCDDVLWAIVAKSTAYYREDRYASMDEMHEAMERYAISQKWISEQSRTSALPPVITMTAEASPSLPASPNAETSTHWESKKRPKPIQHRAIKFVVVTTAAFVLTIALASAFKRGQTPTRPIIDASSSRPIASTMHEAVQTAASHTLADSAVISVHTSVHDNASATLVSSQAADAGSVRSHRRHGSNPSAMHHLVHGTTAPSMPANPPIVNQQPTPPRPPPSNPLEEQLGGGVQ